MKANLFVLAVALFVGSNALAENFKCHLTEDPSALAADGYISPHFDIKSGESQTIQGKALACTIQSSENFLILTLGTINSSNTGSYGNNQDIAEAHGRISKSLTVRGIGKGSCVCFMVAQ
jgi:hypothetical protein